MEKCVFILIFIEIYTEAIDWTKTCGNVIPDKSFLSCCNHFFIDKTNFSKFVEMIAGREIYILYILLWPFLLMQCKLFFSLVNSVEEQGCCQNWWFDLSMGDHASFRAWRWRNQEVWSHSLYFFPSVFNGLCQCIYKYGGQGWSSAQWWEHLPVASIPGVSFHMPCLVSMEFVGFLLNSERPFSDYLGFPFLMSEINILFLAIYFDFEVFSILYLCLTNFPDTSDEL